MGGVPGQLQGYRRQGGPSQSLPSSPAQGLWHPYRLPSCRLRGVQEAAAATRSLFQHGPGHSGPNFLSLVPAARVSRALPARIADVSHAGLWGGPSQSRAHPKWRLPVYQPLWPVFRGVATRRAPTPSLPDPRAHIRFRKVSFVAPRTLLSKTGKLPAAPICRAVSSFRLREVRNLKLCPRDSFERFRTSGQRDSDNRWTGVSRCRTLLPQAENEAEKE